jgi:hypothetical protein
MYVKTQPRVLGKLQDTLRTSQRCVESTLETSGKHVQLIVNAGGVAAIVDNIMEARGNNRLPGIMTLGRVLHSFRV